MARAAEKRRNHLIRCRNGARNRQPCPTCPSRSGGPFPVCHLPDTIRAFVATVATAMRCDPTYAALPALSVCSGMIGATRAIKLKTSWHEPVITWTAVVGESGTLKTPPYKRAIAPVIALQTEHIKRHVEAAKAYRTELREYERNKKKAGAGDPGDPPTPPVCTRIYSRDTTIEGKLAGILTNNRDRFLVGRDELSGWLASFNQYKAKGGSDLANWLELHGLGTLCVDRKTGDVKLVFVSGVGVSLCGGIQPGVLRPCSPPSTSAPVCQPGCCSPTHRESPRNGPRTTSTRRWSGRYTRLGAGARRTPTGVRHRGGAVSRRANADSRGQRRVGEILSPVRQATGRSGRRLGRRVFQTRRLRCATRPFSTTSVNRWTPEVTLRSR